MNVKYIIAGIVVLAVIGTLGYVFWPRTAAQTGQQPNGQTQTINNSNGSDYQPNMNPEVKKETLKEGSGPEAKTGDLVTVNYTGTLTNGTKFDSSLNPGRTPFQFRLGAGGIIEGWELGVLGMKVGEKRRLTIPPELGYGAAGAGALIPPNATLVFEIDLLKIN
jgi:FKBP-type peptidyl-prolyl cis-trans isomerase